MLYYAYEFAHAAVTPMRQAARYGFDASSNPLNPWSHTYQGRVSAATLEMFISATRRYGKPEFGLATTPIDGKDVAVVENVVWQKPFCDLLHFKRQTTRKDAPVLIVAPLSGHYATLLRGTVEQMLPEHDVYITDWVDARNVPVTAGEFDLDDYADYVTEMLEFLYEKTGERASVLAVCQPGIPVLVSATNMASDDNPARPASITLMGAPVDTSKNPMAPNDFAMSKPLSWFEKNVVLPVPFPNKGVMRRVYPGFLQLSGFMSMNLDRHMSAHTKQYRHLVKGDGESAESHRKFYDEYMAVMDLNATYYLQTIDKVFQRRLLAIGEYDYRGKIIDPGQIKDIGIFTIEGEKDDITGLGQTEAAHDLLVNVPTKMHKHYVQEKVGHYGVFNGSRWREKTYPQVAAFITENRDNKAKTKVIAN